jgi:hypothetical protein
MTNEPQLVGTYPTPTAKALGLNLPQALLALASERREFITLFGGGHPPLLLQQIPDLQHGFHTPAPLGES